jgi:hypothetical protein
MQGGTFVRYALVPIFYGIAHGYSVDFFNDTTLVVCIAILSFTNGYMASSTCTNTLTAGDNIQNVQ